MAPRESPQILIKERIQHVLPKTDEKARNHGVKQISSSESSWEVGNQSSTHA